MAIQTFSSGQTLTAAQMNSLQQNDYNQTVSAKTTSYTLVAGDVGTHVQMTAATATTISVPAATFAAGDSLFISSQGAGAVTIQAASTAITVTGSSTSLALYGGGTLRFQSSSAATFFKQGGGTGYGVATGGIGAATSTGTLADGFSYSLLTFNSTGTLTVTTAGWFDYLAIGGGGGAQRLGGTSGGGGGAGQLVCGSVYLSANQTITIGAGSSFYNYVSTNFNQAGNTTIAATAPFAINALGNQVSSAASSFVQVGYVGGGVGAAGGATPSAITESTALGFRGGASTSNPNNAGGGGGQSARGGNGAGTTGGAGGAGFDISAFVGGSAAFRAQGAGGGGSTAGGAAATNGVAGSANTTPPSGGANTGQGGGGGFGDITTGNGGSGVCFIRFR